MSQKEAREARKWAARRRIIDGEDGAATWATAIYGYADQDTVEFLAWAGVKNAEGARERWRRQLGGEP